MQRDAKEMLKNYLANRGLRITRQRRIILEAFIEYDRHLHLDEFYPMLRSRYPGVGHATVYRALKLFAESGIAREIRFGDGLTRYELASDAQRHDHLLCTACGSVTEFDSSDLGQFQANIARSHGFQVESLQIQLRGICSGCLAGRIPGGVNPAPRK